jgi:hypothetical protein
MRYVFRQGVYNRGYITSISYLLTDFSSTPILHSGEMCSVIPCPSWYGMNRHSSEHETIPFLCIRRCDAGAPVRALRCLTAIDSPLEPERPLP